MRKLLTWLGRLTVSLVIACAFGYGFYGLYTYVIPLQKGDLVGAMESRVADRSEVLINGACDAYEQGKFDDAAMILELALEKLVDKSGRFDLANSAKLESVFFMLGKCYHLQEKFDKAIQNYEDTLRLNPNHLPAKYNLEMIQMDGGKGGNGGGGKTRLQPKI